MGKYSKVEFLKFDSLAKIIYCYRRFHGKIDYGPLVYQDDDDDDDDDNDDDDDDYVNKPIICNRLRLLQLRKRQFTDE